MAIHDTEYERQKNTNKKQNTAQSGRVTTPNAAPPRRVTTPNTAPSGRVTTPNAAPSGRVTTPNMAPSRRVTTPNAAPSAHVTPPNAASPKRATTPNNIPYGRATTPNAAEAVQIASQPGTNTQVVSISNLPSGTHITDEIKITERLNPSVQGGESVMYKCKLGDGQEDYVLKIFLRQIDKQEFEAKEQLIQAMKGMRFVAPVLRYGRYSGNYYEVIPYYKNGSLADRLQKGTFSEAEIRRDVLPKLNDALQEIHQAGIIHADIKPPNILYSNNRKSFVLIDFGISKITDERRFVTTAGKSADYAAPEIQLGRVARESDYFSLGITLYELFSGKTPTADVDDKDVAFALLLQNGGRIRKKEGMSDNFYALLLQLTYQYIVPENANQDFPADTRWSYPQVKKWLSLEKIPEEALHRILRPSEVPVVKQPLVFTYNLKDYNSLNELIIAMSRSQFETAYHYAMAAQDSFSAALDVGCRSNDAWTRETMLALRKKYRAFRDKLPESLPQEEKLILFFYTFSENLDELYLPTLELIEVEDLSGAGFTILEEMNGNRKAAEEAYRPLLTRGILQSYLLQRNKDDMLPTEHRVLNKLDELCRIAHRDDTWPVAVWALGYILAGNEPYRIGKLKFENIHNLTAYLANLGNDPRRLVELVGKMTRDSKSLSDRFAGWLISQNVPYNKMTL